MQTWSKSGASSLYVCECMYVHVGVYWNPHKEWMMLSLSFSSSGYSPLEEWWQRIPSCFLYQPMCFSESGVFPISDRHAEVFVKRCLGGFFSPHSLLPHNYLYLLRTGCHREINASKNEKFLYAETLLCMPVLPQTREVTVVWRPYIPVQEAVFTMWLQGILARSRALSVQWWQYWKIKKICNCTNT